MGPSTRPGPPPVASIPDSAPPKAHLYDASYVGAPNWDIGRPQRAFVYLEDAGLVRDPVLDVGCGTGELSLFLANRGHDVLGIDVSPRAIYRARSKAHWRRNPAQFLVWDALRLEHLGNAGFTFRTVVDSAMFHVFRFDERAEFVADLGAVVPSGGAYYVLGDARRRQNDVYGISPAEIEAWFGDESGWSVEFVYETVFERRYSQSRAYFAGIRRL